jgi:hypothetical protein
MPHKVAAHTYKSESVCAFNCLLQDKGMRRPVLKHWVASGHVIERRLLLSVAKAEGAYEMLETW